MLYPFINANKLLPIKSKIDILKIIYFTIIIIGNSLLLTACNGIASSLLQNKPHTVHISQSKMQEKINSHFPMMRQVMGIASVTIQKPQLQLIPNSNRIGTVLQIHIPPVLGLTPDLSGEIKMSYGLRYDATIHAVRLHDLVVQSVTMRDTQGKTNVWLNAALSALGAQILQDIGLYQLKSADISKMQAMGYYLSYIQVVEDGLDITFEPKSHTQL